MNKVVIIDSGFIAHRSIYSWSAQKKRQFESKSNGFILPSNYNYFNSCMSILKKIGIDRDDLVIIAGDGRNSWRKAFYPIYKANRKELRAKQTHIDWDYHYKQIRKLEEELHFSTNWYFILLNYIFNFADLALTEEGKRMQINHHEFDTEFSIESDDIQAVACRFFSDKEVILVTIDEDLDQLLYYDNVKIFNPNLKYKSKKGYYKFLKKKPLEILDKKIRLGDVSDNILVDKKNDTEEEVEKRKFIIDLLNLPSFVEDPIISVLKDIEPKPTRYDILPFPKSLGKRERFDKIYGAKDIVSMERSKKAFIEREEKLKESRKKAYQRKKVKKLR